MGFPNECSVSLAQLDQRKRALEEKEPQATEEHSRLSKNSRKTISHLDWKAYSVWRIEAEKRIVEEQKADKNKEKETKSNHNDTTHAHKPINQNTGLCPSLSEAKGWKVDLDLDSALSLSTPKGKDKNRKDPSVPPPDPPDHILSSMQQQLTINQKKIRMK